MQLLRHDWKVVLAVFAATVGSAGSATPPLDGGEDVWELDFAFHDPVRITLTLPGDTRPTAFWYVLYTVTNNTGQDIQFYPTFDLVTDTLSVVTGGENVSPLVTDAIASLHRQRYPFFVAPMKASGLLRQGSDNARTSAAIFKEFDPRSNRFTLFVGGLSGELRKLRNPVFDPSKPESGSNSRFFLLRKTLGITYDLPGDQQTRSQAAPRRVNQEWVMR